MVFFLTALSKGVLQWLLPPLVQKVLGSRTALRWRTQRKARRRLPRLQKAATLGIIVVNMFIAVIGSSINETTGGDTTVSKNADGESADGRTVNAFDTMAVLENRFDNTSTLYQGSTATGDLAFAVPADTADQGVLAVRPDMLADKEFIALQ